MVWAGQGWVLCLEVYRAALLLGMAGIQEDVRAWWEGWEGRCAWINIGAWVALGECVHLGGSTGGVRRF